MESPASPPQGILIISEIVYAELIPQFKCEEELDQTLSKLGVHYIPCSRKATALAGKLWAVLEGKALRTKIKHQLWKPEVIERLRQRARGQ